MEVAAVGGIGAGTGTTGAVTGTSGVTGEAVAAGSTTEGAAATGATAEGTAATGSLDGTFLEGTVPAGEEMLSQVGEDFGALDLLFTLLILALLENADKEGSGGAAVLGFLAGLALASQLGQALSDGLTQQLAGTAGSGGLGGQLDVSA